MADITFTIPDAKLPKVIQAIKQAYPIPPDDPLINAVSLIGYYLFKSPI